MTARGAGTPASCEEAVRLLKLVAETGDPASVLQVAYGRFVGGDYNAALMLYEEGAEQGIEVGQSNAAYLLDRSQHYDLAPDIFVRISPLLICRASTDPILSLSLQMSGGLSRDQRALRWFSLASAQHSLQAHLKLGDYTYYGRGRPADRTLAARTYREVEGTYKSAQAMFNLGYMYHHGEGVPRDLRLAKRYYDLAVELDPSAALPCSLARVHLFAEWAWRLVTRQPISDLSSVAVADVVEYGAVGASAGDEGVTNKTDEADGALDSHTRLPSLWVLCATLLALIYIRYVRQAR